MKWSHTYLDSQPAVLIGATPVDCHRVVKTLDRSFHLSYTVGATFVAMVVDDQEVFLPVGAEEIRWSTVCRATPFLENVNNVAAVID